MIPEPVRVIKPGFDGGSDRSSQKLFVVYFDGGGKTGWCAMRIQLDALLSSGFRGVALSSPDPEVFAWNSGFFSGPEPWQAELMMALVRGVWMYGEGDFEAGMASDLFVVGVEAFRLRVMSTSEDLLSPVRINAAFRQLSWRAPFPLLSAGPSDAMRVFTDARLQAFNLWSGVKGPDGEHQRDATRHAALVARKAASEKGFLDNLEKQMPWIRNKDDQAIVDNK